MHALASKLELAHGVAVPGEDIGLDATAPAPPPPPRDTLATAPALALGSAASTEPARAVPSTRLYLAFCAVAVLGAANIGYFIVRFILTSHPPALHKVFQTVPLVTLASISCVAVLFLGVAIWVARHHRREPITQLMSSLAVLGGQISLSVTLLTSADAYTPARVLAAAVYVLVPLGGFAAIAVFPNGRAVPRFAGYLVPLAVVPFALQARLMLVDRGYSLPLAGIGGIFAALYLGFLWHRYRRHATLREQQQIKWIAYAGVAFAGIQAFAVGVVLPQLYATESALLKVVYAFLVSSSYVVSLACLLFSAARYRVWDVDRLINRTVVYVLVTAVLASAFAIAYFGLLEVMPHQVALTALAVLLLFPVARRKIARWIDRRFYGIGLDYEALAAKAVRAAALPTLGSEIGAYDELHLLGKGGMGAVYRAHHADFAMPVALKVMSPALAGDADAAARFHREARVLEGLRHPHVVPFLASGHERGLAFIAMQYVDGEDLGSLVRRRGALPASEVATIVAGIAEALDAAHARGVVHRDIKPANVFLEHGDPKRALVMDFGVARLVGDPPLPGDDSMVGSLPYMSPEQIQRADQVDGRADIYSLGATAFELLTGRPPFVETNALAYVMAHLRQPPPEPRGVPPHIAAALHKALAKHPEDRYATAGELAAALR